MTTSVRCGLFPFRPNIIMEVRAKKALGQHFLVDQGAAQRIVAALEPVDGRSVSTRPAEDGTEQQSCDVGSPRAAGYVRGGALDRGISKTRDVLEIGPGMGVLTQYLLKREDIDLKMVELDEESVNYLLTHFNGMQGRLFLADYLKLNVDHLFKGPYRIIGNFPYNISSQIFFKILESRDRIPEVVCMIQKEVAERIAEGPGSKTYGILSVLLQAWYDIEYLFTVEPGAFAPPPKVRSAVIRLRRNGRTALFLDKPCKSSTYAKASGENVPDVLKQMTDNQTLVDERLFKTVVKTAFNQRRKTLRNALKPLLNADAPGYAEFVADPVFDLRAERLSVEDFIDLTAKIAGHLNG